jgi:hypothetical protein
MDEAIQMEDECMTGRKMITILITLVHACITSIILASFQSNALPSYTSPPWPVRQRGC